MLPRERLRAGPIWAYILVIHETQVLEAEEKFLVISRTILGGVWGYLFAIFSRITTLDSQVPEYDSSQLPLPLQVEGNWSCRSGFCHGNMTQKR